MTDRFSCARDSQSLLEPLLGTASTVRRWILVEQPGPWGRDAPVDSNLRREVALGLRRRAGDVGARLLLIRRYGRYVPERRTCLVASTTTDGCWVERLSVPDVADLLDVDFTPLAVHRSVGGAPVDGPVLLVCTNGRHDACCAEFGRPLARVLAGTHPEHVWESTHFGGDRFAGNLVCLPHGVYYGRVAPASGPGIVEAYQRGLLDLDHLRGRSCHPFLVQAADYYVRRHTGLLAVDDLVLVGREEVEPDTARVRFETRQARRFTALVKADRQGPPRLLSCSGRPSVAVRYRLLSMSDAADGGAETA
ncbi:MAG: sucrase ferredoxin [Actinomycetota bacterium]|nr:sucrase ferredoxin [Actinomycetota bacterium]